LIENVAKTPIKIQKSSTLSTILTQFKCIRHPEQQQKNTHSSKDTWNIAITVITKINENPINFKEYKFYTSNVL
jgi:hypothetical protein